MSDAQPAPRKVLKVDLADIAATMECGSEIGQSYLDVRSGEIHLLEDDLLRRVEDDDLDGLSDWEKDVVDVARAVLEGSDDYRKIPTIDSAESFDVMRDFVAQVAEGPARQRLERAIAGPKPFRRFKDALLDYPDLRERWFAFDSRAKDEMARQWLKEIGVDPIEP